MITTGGERILGALVRVSGRVAGEFGVPRGESTTGEGTQGYGVLHLCALRCKKPIQAGWLCIRHNTLGVCAGDGNKGRTMLGGAERGGGPRVTEAHKSPWRGCLHVLQ